MVFAGSLRVGLASFVDYMIWTLISVPIWFVVEDESAARVVFAASAFVVLIIYMTVCLSRWGQTLGMRYTGIQVVHADGSLIGYKRILSRSLAFGSPSVLVFFLLFRGSDVLIFFPFLFLDLMCENWNWLRKDEDTLNDDAVVVIVKRAAEEA